MADHYSILGLTKTASAIEIKSAFRKLAKIYHPDKNSNNPNAKLLFENIMIAYDVLSHPEKKRRYDAGFGNTTSSKQTSNKNTQPSKNWNVTPEELQQRQYYQNYYKAKQKERVIKQQAKPYSDYKYILFATPLAVGLLLLIVSMFSPIPKTENKITESKVVNDLKKNSLENGFKPYIKHYGEAQIFDTKNVLKINNSTGFDAVIVLFNVKTKKHIQHSYLKNGYLIEFDFLPNDGVYWKCVIGEHWDENKAFCNNAVFGGFNNILQYQNWESKPFLFTKSKSDVIEVLSELDVNSEYKNYISDETNFFQKK